MLERVNLFYPLISEFLLFLIICLVGFWTPDYEFSRNVVGVLSTVVGYAGGSQQWPTYKAIKDFTEAIRIEFDPSVISFEEILEECFIIQQGAPTSPALSRQYRRAILVHNQTQREVAEEVIERHRRMRRVKRIHCDVEAATEFYQAEEYHQKYLEKTGRRR